MVFCKGKGKGCGFIKVKAKINVMVHGVSVQHDLVCVRGEPHITVGGEELVKR